MRRNRRIRRDGRIRFDFTNRHRCEGRNGLARRGFRPRRRERFPDARVMRVRGKYGGRMRKAGRSPLCGCWLRGRRMPGFGRGIGAVLPLGGVPQRPMPGAERHRIWRPRRAGGVVARAIAWWRCVPPRLDGQTALLGVDSVPLCRQMDHFLNDVGLVPTVGASWVKGRGSSREEPHGQIIRDG